MTPLKNKIFQLFDVYVPEEQTQTEAIKEINRRGKIDKVKLTAIVFLLADEIDRLSKEKK